MPDRVIALVVYDGLTPLDIVGPIQVFAELRDQFALAVVAERIEELTTDTPLKLVASHTFAEVPRPDILVIGGGGSPTIRQTSNPVMLEYVRAAAETASVVASVCTGSIILAAAGLLGGRRATTHWRYREGLRRLGATYEPERWVEDGKFITGAGVSAGIDLALAVVEKVAGRERAQRAQAAIEYDPHPPQGPMDLSAYPSKPYTADEWEAFVTSAILDPDRRRELLLTAHRMRELPENSLPS